MMSYWSEDVAFDIINKCGMPGEVHGAMCRLQLLGPLRRYNENAPMAITISLTATS